MLASFTLHVAWFQKAGFFQEACCRGSMDVFFNFFHQRSQYLHGVVHTFSVWWASVCENCMRGAFVNSTKYFRHHPQHAPDCLTHFHLTTLGNVWHKTFEPTCTCTSTPSNVLLSLRTRHPFINCSCECYDHAQSNLCSQRSQVINIYPTLYVLPNSCCDDRVRRKQYLCWWSRSETWRCLLFWKHRWWCCFEMIFWKYTM